MLKGGDSNNLDRGTRDSISFSSARPNHSMCPSKGNGPTKTNERSRLMSWWGGAIVWVGSLTPTTDLSHSLYGASNCTIKKKDGEWSTCLSVTLYIGLGNDQQLGPTHLSQHLELIRSGPHLSLLPSLSLSLSLSLKNLNHWCSKTIERFMAEIF